jgi:hypothetical protein
MREVAGRLFDQPWWSVSLTLPFFIDLPGAKQLYLCPLELAAVLGRLSIVELLTTNVHHPDSVLRSGVCLALVRGHDAVCYRLLISFPSSVSQAVIEDLIAQAGEAFILRRMCELNMTCTLREVIDHLDGVDQYLLRELCEDAAGRGHVGVCLTLYRRIEALGFCPPALIMQHVGRLAFDSILSGLVRTPSLCLKRAGISTGLVVGVINSTTKDTQPAVDNSKGAIILSARGKTLTIRRKARLVQ